MQGNTACWQHITTLRQLSIQIFPMPLYPPNKKGVFHLKNWKLVGKINHTSFLFTYCVRLLIYTIKANCFV